MAIANHYLSHRDEINCLLLDIERADTEISSLRTNLDRAAGDHAHADRQHDGAVARATQNDERVASLVQDRDDDDNDDAVPPAIQTENVLAENDADEQRK